MFPAHITHKSDFLEISRDTVTEFLHGLLKLNFHICFKDAISCHSCNSWQLVGSTLLVKIQFIFQEVISREHLLNLPFAAQSDLTAMTIDI